jgi:hypothetical protein
MSNRFVSFRKVNFEPKQAKKNIIIIIIIIIMGRVLIEKLIVVQLVKKFASFYGTRRLVSVFTRACQWALF